MFAVVNDCWCWCLWFVSRPTPNTQVHKLEKIALLSEDAAFFETGLMEFYPAHRNSPLRTRMLECKRGALKEARDEALDVRVDKGRER